MSKNPTYKLIKFHTHSRGTISAHGNYFANNFSDGDISSIKEELDADRDFMALLVTPKIFLLYGIDSPELHIVDDFPDYIGWKNAVDDSFKIIARNLGYTLRDLRVR